jgi:hypothetical protein
MNQTLDVQELSLVIAVERQDPSLLTPDFLRYSGIIPEDWELSGQPVRAQQAARVSFQNGISILAYPDRTVFVESFGDKASENLELPQLAQRYSEVLRNLNFQAVGVNFRGHVLFPGAEDSAHQYLCNTLLSPGSWQTMGTAPMRAGLNLVYTFERNTMNLSVQEAMMQLPEQERVPVVLFTANFETPLQSLSETDHLTGLQQALSSWQADLGNYRQVVDKLLNRTPSEYLIPMPAMPV